MPGVVESTEHEQVVSCRDQASGLHAIIAIHSTVLGPALGGTRFYPYGSEEDALSDVLRLSRAMTHKAACAGLDLGGGKAVIIGDPVELKTEPLLRAYGRFVESLAGRYYTACDVGTFPDDMDVIARESRFVTGRTRAHGGAGDSSELTAFGVFMAMRAAAAHTWATPSLRGRRVGVAGAGKVGRRLVEHLLADGASIVVADVASAAVDQLRSHHPEVEAEDPQKLLARDLDVYAPCALGGVLNDETVPALQAEIVCGGANNQLAHAGIATLLREYGVLYLPDYVVNAGGLIQVADEIAGFNEQRARARAEKIFDTCQRILAMATDHDISPAQAADHLAEQRIADIARPRGSWRLDQATAPREVAP
ncbi:Glu/Leu/Phe/Val family dehydrogenase [Prauserella flavalba]|uniref:Valine dehydrogenase n=1 Tax=Prauserella flavalba TaxID=1477506 RepID=A0A318LJU2_9PSEU|nr:Glu/Leu/Phe/Val dehydrogenase dimerization domain-containing protein [Prauserella flavalba]PXY26376.1 valine dehydrogenase [Prauserella flavalba]